MVDFVLQELGAIPLQLDLVAFALEILVAHADVVGALHSHQQVGEGETIVPDREILRADIHDLGINKGPGLLHLALDNPDRSANLGGGNPAPAAKARLPVSQRLAHVVHDDPDRGRPGLGNEVAARPQDGVAQQPDAMNRHGPNLRLRPGFLKSGGDWLWHCSCFFRGIAYYYYQIAECISHSLLGSLCFGSPGCHYANSLQHSGFDSLTIPTVLLRIRLHINTGSGRK